MKRLTNLVLPLLLGPALFSCSVQVPKATQFIPGQSVLFNGAQALSWATLDPTGKVSEVGLTLPYAVIQNTVSSGDPSQAMAGITLDVPAQVRSTTFIDHLALDWMPMGHEPSRYLTPHFDLHFYGIDKAAVAAVDCKDATQLPAADVPSGWVPAVPPTLPDPTVACVPQMGYHALPVTEFSGQAPAPGLFDKVMIAGSYGGKFTFIEPMLTKAVLERKASFTLPVPQPKGIKQWKLYPASFHAVYDGGLNAYQFVFTDFTPRN